MKLSVELAEFLEVVRYKLGETLPIAEVTVLAIIV
jgi:hypothetical protein